MKKQFPNRKNFDRSFYVTQVSNLYINVEDINRIGQEDYFKLKKDKRTVSGHTGSFVSTGHVY